MAIKLKEFDFATPSPKTMDKATYYWDDWFDGDIWELTQGEDFHGHPLMMERIIRTRATSRKAKIQLRHVGVNGDSYGKVVIQRTNIEGPNERKRREAREKRAKTIAEKKASNGVPLKAGPSKKPARKLTASTS